MKVLHLSNSDSNGAGRAALRLHRGLRKLNVGSQLLVQYKLGDDPAVLPPQMKLEKASLKLKLTEHLDNLPLRLYRQRKSSDFSLEWVPDFIAAKVTDRNPGIINLHWVCHGFLNIETLKRF